MAPILLHWPILYYICETFFFGIYTALFTFSTVFLLSKQARTRTRSLLLAASITMYVVSAIHWAISISLLVRAAKNGSVVEIDMTPIEMLANAYLPAISSTVCLSDAIVVWRAWVLWEHRYNLFVPPILFLLGTIATSAASAALTFKDASNDAWQAELGIVDRFAYPICGLTILTNLWTTGLICIRAWQHRHFLRSLMGKSNSKTRAEKVLAFLIESGSIYLCVWVAYLSVVPTSSGGRHLVAAALTHVIGIYPTAIVVVVTMRLSTADILSQPGRSEPLVPPTPIAFMSRSLQPESFDGSASGTSDIASSHGSVPSPAHAPTFIVECKISAERMVV
ncbi:hypothetical protein BC834DRAFT_1039468 [Gloeopeniophorella convolvens]|nr:hypothetical protein BC834DRAFT_1039468 [Gloeopeniophorella convolvens]